MLTAQNTATSFNLPRLCNNIEQESVLAPLLIFKASAGKERLAYKEREEGSGFALIPFEFISYSFWVHETTKPRDTLR